MMTGVKGTMCELAFLRVQSDPHKKRLSQPDTSPPQAPRTSSSGRSTSSGSNSESVKLKEIICNVRRQVPIDAFNVQSDPHVSA